jgi:hypothetical protein
MQFGHGPTRVDPLPQRQDHLVANHPSDLGEAAHPRYQGQESGRKHGVPGVYVVGETNLRKFLSRLFLNGALHPANLFNFSFRKA